MSLWQGTRWTQRQNQSPAIHGPRTSLSGNSSAATSTVSLVSSNSGTAPAPRRPLNQLNLRQEGRSNSISRAKPVDAAKADHDPVKALTGILGELPESSAVQEPDVIKDGASAVQGKRKIDAGGRTLEKWLEELEKDKLNKLSKDIEQRMTTYDTANRRNYCVKPISGTSDINHST